MKKLAKPVYIIKLLLFIIHFYFVYVMLNNILDTKIYGIIFIIIYLLLSIKIILEIISKKTKYQNDIIYNIMQIGFFVYLLIISVRTAIAKVYVTRITISYFKINYIILSVLIIFILTYSLLENKSSK